MFRNNASNNNNSKCEAPAFGVTQISFKDWKRQKDNQSKGNVSERNQQHNNNRNSAYEDNNHKHPLWKQNLNQNSFNNRMPGQSFASTPNSANNGFNNNFLGSIFQDDRNGFNFQNSMNFNNYNNYNADSIFKSNGLIVSNSFSRQPAFGNGRQNNMQNYIWENNNNMLNNCNNNQNRFFQTDELFPQKDMLRVYNPFNANKGCSHLPRTNNHYNKKQSGEITTAKPKEQPQTVMKSKETSHKIETKLEPKVLNKKKGYIPFPNNPDTMSCATAEERKQQWRDYREAMKPFKNKDFHNARRVIQRLGKKDPQELQEYEKLRLETAKRKMMEHKQKINNKYNSYIKTENNSQNKLGEVFVLKPDNTNRPYENDNSGNYKTNTKAIQNY